MAERSRSRQPIWRGSAITWRGDRWTNAIKNTPQLARNVRGMSEDSVGFANEVKKFLVSRRTRLCRRTEGNVGARAGYGADANGCLCRRGHG